MRSPRVTDALTASGLRPEPRERRFRLAPAPRISNRLAKLAQAIRKTNATAPAKISSSFRTSATNISFKGMTRADKIHRHSKGLLRGRCRGESCSSA